MIYSSHPPFLPLCLFLLYFALGFFLTSFLLMFVMSFSPYFIIVPCAYASLSFFFMFALISFCPYCFVSPSLPPFLYSFRCLGSLSLFVPPFLPPFLSCSLLHLLHRTFVLLCVIRELSALSLSLFLVVALPPFSFFMYPSFFFLFSVFISACLSDCMCVCLASCRPLCVYVLMHRCRSFLLLSFFIDLFIDTAISLFLPSVMFALLAFFLSLVPPVPLHAFPLPCVVCLLVPLVCLSSFLLSFFLRYSSLSFCILYLSRRLAIISVFPPRLPSSLSFPLFHSLLLLLSSFPSFVCHCAPSLHMSSPFVSFVILSCFISPAVISSFSLPVSVSFFLYLCMSCFFVYAFVFFISFLLSFVISLSCIPLLYLDVFIPFFLSFCISSLCSFFISFALSLLSCFRYVFLVPPVISSVLSSSVPRLLPPSLPSSPFSPAFVLPCFVSPSARSPSFFPSLSVFISCLVCCVVPVSPSFVSLVLVFFISCLRPVLLPFFSHPDLFSRSFVVSFFRSPCVPVLHSLLLQRSVIMSCFCLHPCRPYFLSVRLSLFIPRSCS